MCGLRNDVVVSETGRKRREQVDKSDVITQSYMYLKIVSGYNISHTVYNNIVAHVFWF